MCLGKFGVVVNLSTTAKAADGELLVLVLDRGHSFSIASVYHELLDCECNTEYFTAVSRSL